MILTGGGCAGGGDVGGREGGGRSWGIEVGAVMMGEVEMPPWTSVPEKKHEQLHGMKCSKAKKKEKKKTLVGFFTVELYNEVPRHPVAEPEMFPWTGHRVRS